MTSRVGCAVPTRIEIETMYFHVTVKQFIESIKESEIYNP